MAGSQLKQLKAKLHARRDGKAAKSSGKQLPSPNPQSVGKKPPRRDSKAAADSLRRSTLLPAIQNRHKVGGIIDRRIGENDPTMSPEQRMLQRYARQHGKRGNIFDLENEDGEDEQLTHGGRNLFDISTEDFAEGDFGGENDDDGSTFPQANKRGWSDLVGENGDTADEPDRKKSKKEVMEEVIAKSKYYKYERQKAKDEDEDVRDELDKELPDLLAALRAGPRVAQKFTVSESVGGVAMHPDRAAQVSQSAEERSARAAKEYDQRLRQLALDKRAQPAERTKTEEEKAAEEALRLKELEANRIRRMVGEEDHSDTGGEDGDSANDDRDIDEHPNEASLFGMRSITDASSVKHTADDEDDFVIDEDLVASGSDVDTDFSYSSDTSDGSHNAAEDDDEDFLRDVLPETHNTQDKDKSSPDASKIAYTFPCPETHTQLLDITKGIRLEDLPVVIQRIRALYHPQLNPLNKEKLSRFASSLIDHLSYMGTLSPPIGVVETVIRHVHSLSKAHATATSVAFRTHLQKMHERETLELGDLFILTAIGSIYPTSDHFHQVVTPAITLMARWLGTTVPRTNKHSRIGAYIVALCIKYQQLSKRYIPEAVQFTTAMIEQDPKSSLAHAHIRNLLAMADLWASKSAFFEIFYPSAYKALKKTGDARAKQHLRIALSQSTARRRPLELHHHRPLPIKTSVPKFEEGFNPNKHYDPDRERAESNKLKKEYKRERKGAVRELRKDAAFMHRESLREKKERDLAYERKQRRLIQEIQGEEGREANKYEREKRKRKGER